MSKSYYDIVIPLIQGRSVLDVGSVAHYRDSYKIWNFSVLKQHAAKLKGFDRAAAEVAQARAEGHDIEIGDAETYIAAEQYDVVFAGDLIEHLSNPGLFLDCAYKNLTPTGLLIIATPNAYSFAKLARIVGRLTNEPPVNPEHTCYFTPQTLQQLVVRHAFTRDRVEYCDFQYGPSHGSTRKRLQLAINSTLSGLLPSFSQTMLAVCSKVAL